MDTRRIGSLTVSLAGLGCNNFGSRLDESATREVVHAALDAGITFFDTADIYGGTRSEEFLGRALAGRRDRVVIATKFGHEVSAEKKGADPAYVRRAVEDSLHRLGTDRIDLYQLHRPDPKVPIADTLEVLDELVRAGKVVEIGCSNFSVEQIREAEGAAPPGAARFVSVQNEYSLLHREPEGGVLAECERLGLAFLPFFPLASGMLTGKYRKNRPFPKGTRIQPGARYDRLLTERNLNLVERLTSFAESRGHTLLELACSWLAGHAVVASVIAGASSPAQVGANAQAVGWRLTADEMRQVDALAHPDDSGHINTGEGMATRCTHLDQVRDVAPRTPRGCKECLATGSRWVHLRLCLICGHVGCCDSSPNRHATKHFHQTAHPIVRSFERGEDWGWCYVDEVMMEPAPRAGRQ